VGEDAQTEQQNGTMPQQVQQTQPQEQKAQPEPRQFRGEILKEKEVQIRGKDQTNRVILLKTGGGQRIAVDIGPSRDLADVNIQVGRNVAVKGRLVRIGDRMVLFAAEVDVNGKNIRINRIAEEPRMHQKETEPQRDAGMETQEQTGRMQQFSGRIVRERDVSVKNTGVRNKLVLLKTAEGRIIAADLGPTEATRDIRFTAEQPIQVRGYWVRVGSQPVIFVRELTMNGKTTAIQHPVGRFTSRWSKQVKGEIIREKNVSLKGTDLNNKVVLLKTEKDQQVLVDLGRVQNLEGVPIQKGRQIEVQGWPVRIGDQMVLLARQLKVNGRTIDIQRMQPPRDGQIESQPEESQTP